jgi:hypothetical protein
MPSDHSEDIAWTRTHYMLTPEQRMGADRRKAFCFVANDRRSGIACRRKEKRRELERRMAYAKVKFYPDYYRI